VCESPCVIKEPFSQAEARLAARRQARYEARNIRLKELEKKRKAEEKQQQQQEDQDNNGDKVNQNNIYPGENEILLVGKRGSRLSQLALTRVNFVRGRK